MQTINMRKKPCSQCPYTLGLIHTLVNPCPQCKLNGYRSFKWFRKQLMGEHMSSSNKNRHNGSIMNEK